MVCIEYELSNQILLFLYKKAQGGQNPSVQSKKLQKEMQGRNWKKEGFHATFLLAIGELIDNHLILQDVDCYQITEIGKGLARKLMPARLRPLNKFVSVSLVFLVIFVSVNILSSANALYPRTLFLKLSLSDMTNDDKSPLKTSRLSDWFDPAPENLIIKEPFILSPQSLVVETGSQNSTNHYLMTYRSISKVRHGLIC